MNQTTNYQLSQWEASDRILMDDFNSDNAKIDGALAGKVGRGQLIRSTQTELAASSVSVDLSDIDWNDWEWVSVFLGYRANYSTEAVNIIYCDLNTGSPTTYCSAGTGLLRSQPNPVELVLLSRRDAANQVRTLAFGNPGGAGVGECTFGELTHVRFHYTVLGDGYSTKFWPNMKIEVWGGK